ncbi:uncharacterized protein LOC143234805 isoform X3 [Tachypleus tridentatus]|uniref:uncharacterized protein LOC143234805 isoform X3 n=1 Tax=Tachypleus tridentatus TaxID=6853 RepID=UPI003FD19AD8
MTTWETLKRCHLFGYFLVIVTSHQYKTEQIFLPDAKDQRNLHKFEEHVRLRKFLLATKPKQYETQTVDGSLIQHDNTLRQSFGQDWITNTPEVTVVLPLDYHLVERLFDGLRQVMEELSIILKFQKIYSLLDRLDAICMISDIMKANVELVSNSYLDEEYIKVVLSSTDKLLTNQNSSISVNSDTQLGL